MKRNELVIKLAVILFLALGVSALRTPTVRADEGAPSPTATPAATQPANDGSAVAQPTAAVTQVTEVSTPAPSAPAPARHKTASTADARAKTLSMPAPAKQGDPIWCPSGVAPKANTGGCTNTYTSFNYIDPANTGLAGSLSGKSTSGTVWIASGYDSSLEAGSPVSLDKGLLGTTANFALTMQGGWNGIPGSTTVSGSSTFGVPLSINWNADVTLNNLEITGISDSGSDALDVTTPKNITLNTINVHDNAGAGAVLDNSSGTGNVAVTSSQFKNNSNGDGLDVYSKGTISLSGVAADGNSGNGAYLDNHTAAGAMNVTLPSSGDEFDLNGNDGLDIYSRGAITLADIDALTNSTNGVYLKNTYAPSAQNVTLSGSNAFSENGGDGLDVYSLGAVTANNLEDNSNEGWGAEIYNQTAATPQPVTLTGSSNQFKSNLDGLKIFSKGAITLNNTMADYNTGDNGQDPNGTYYASGAWLDNCQYNTTACTGSGNVILNGTNAFENNDRSGLYILSAGTITSNNLSADGNGHDSTTPGGVGAYLDNSLAFTPKTVTLTGVNQFGYNENDGLDVYSKGTISAATLKASNNQDQAGGVYLDNTAGNGNVTVTGTNVISNNSWYGLHVVSNGAISLNNLDAEQNGGYGVRVDNSTAPSPQPVTITGSNQFNFNGKDGLNVLSHGIVSLNNISAFNDGQDDQDLNTATPPYYGYGVYIVNDDPLHPASHQNVTFTGNNAFENNWYGGLAVNSYGAITISSITASNNGQGGFSNVPAGSNGMGGTADWADGVYLDNCLDPLAACSNPIAESVSVSGTNSFDGNDGSGLVVYSSGAITTNNIETSWNSYGWGVEADNAYAGMKGSVSLNGYINDYEDGFGGISVTSFGSITGNDLNVNNSGGNCLGSDCHGASLVNSGASTAAPVTLTGWSNFSNDTYDGLYITTKGAITATNMSAGNNTIGEWLDNSSASTPQPVTLNGKTGFTGNSGDGLDVMSKGAITIANVWQAGGNGGNGAFLNNSFAGGVGNVTVTESILYGVWGFDSDGGNGLQVTSLGAISITNLHAWNDSGIDALLDNSSAVTPQPVTIAGQTNLDQGNAYGLDVQSKGAITVNNLEAGNDRTGALLDNSSAAKPQPVNLTGATNVSNNQSGDGLDVNSKGAITITDLQSAGGNSINGAVLNNAFTGAAGNVVVTEDTAMNTWGFSNNSGNGLQITSLGAITVSNLTVNNNSGYGVLLDNHTAATPQSVTVNGFAEFSSNGNNGLEIQTRGAVTTNNLDSDGSNNGSGAVINNQYNMASPQNVTLNGKNTFRWNGGGSGLAVTSYGTITVNNLTAISNGWNTGATGWGAYLDNCGYNASTCNSNLSKAITLTGTSTIYSNNQDGLWATSKGAITASSLTSGWNSGRGAYLDNQWGTGSSGGVILTGTNTFQNNSARGLEIYSNGSATLNNLTANNNSGDGILVNVLGLTIPQNVTLTGTNVVNSNGDFGTNTGDGLYILADGNISLNNLNATWNAQNGASLDNCLWSAGSCKGSGTITLTGSNMFSSNNVDGLDFVSQGNDTLSGVMADQNGNEGVNGTSHGGSISILGGGMTCNSSYGWDLWAGTTATLRGVFAYGNNGGSGNTNPEHGNFIYIRS